MNCRQQLIEGIVEVFGEKPQIGDVVGRTEIALRHHGIEEIVLL